MSDPKRTAERNAGAFLGPDMMIPAPMNALNEDRPGLPDPEDGWKIPLGPIDEIDGNAGATPEPAHAGHGTGWLHRLTHRG